LLDGSGTGRGERRAPAALRQVGVVERLGAWDFGNLEFAIDDPLGILRACLAGHRVAFRTMWLPRASGARAWGKLGSTGQRPDEEGAK
jgi:hypothetical protein